jgi:hypothetical protein
MNLYKRLGIVTAISVFLTIFGYWAKLTHQAYADKVLTIGLWTLAACTAIFVYSMISSSGRKD